MVTIVFCGLAFAISLIAAYFAVREKSALLACYAILGIVAVGVSLLFTMQRVRTGESDVLFGTSLSAATLYFTSSVFLFAMTVLISISLKKNQLLSSPLNSAEILRLVMGVPISFLVGLVLVSIIYWYFLNQ